MQSESTVEPLFTIRRRVVYRSRDMEFDLIYVNGETTSPTFAAPTKQGRSA